MSTLSVAEFIHDISFESLPSEVISQAKKAIRDVIGIMIVSNNNQAVKAAANMMISRGGVPESTILGTKTKVPCESATFANTIMANTLDLDDGLTGMFGDKRRYFGHPGCHVVPSSLSVAERNDVSGRNLIEGIVAGYEIAATTGWMMAETGEDALVAARTGSFGASASAAKLSNLTQEEIVNALGIVEAHSPSAPLRHLLIQANMTKESCGWGAKTGVNSVLLAQAGFCGPPTLYDLPGFSKKPIEVLGKEWGIMSLYFKPYSMCRWEHSAIDGILEIMHQNSFSADDILEIRIGVASAGGLQLSNPKPTNIWEAEFSIPFAIGATIVHGKLGPGQLAESQLNNKSILELAEKVKLKSDAEIDSLWPGIFAARVEVNLKNSTTYNTFIKHPRGDLENPLSDNEMQDKFITLAENVIGLNRAKELDDCINQLETIHYSSDFIKLINDGMIDE